MSGRPRLSALRRLAWPALIALVLAGVVSLGYFPTRTYLNQRSATAAAQARLDKLSSRNDDLQQQVDLLGSDAEIERVARQEFGWAKPGEEIYQILPAPEDPAALPPAWPFDHLAQQLDR